MDRSISSIRSRTRGFARAVAAVVGLTFAVLLTGCAKPPIRPAVSQTVVTIQRHSSRILARRPMEVYIDNVKSSYTVPNGEFISIPVNDGVHTIQVKIGNVESEILNFTAAQRTVSFVVSVERPNPLGRPKVILSRSEVRDDTGQMTDRDIQERFVPNE